jgi:HlyD family secretion protein
MLAHLLALAWKTSMNKKLMIGIAGAAIVAVGAVAMLTRGPSRANTGDYSFETAVVERGDVARIVTASGTVQPLNMVDVGSEVSGKITQIFVDFNDPVKKDQVLAQIDPETFQTAVESAQARYLQSQASVENARSAIERSKVNLDNAERTYNRQKALFAEQAISQQAWEQAERDYKYAQLDVNNNEVSLRSNVAGLEQSRAALQEARTRLDRTKIRSPMDGVILSRAVEVGQTVQSSMNVAKFFTIAQDLSQIEIQASVVESDIGGVDAGDPVTFNVDAFMGQRFQGNVSQVRKQGAEAANVVTYTVVISARNPNGVLLPGMTANVEITADRANDVLRIANQATTFQPPRELAEAMAAAEGPPGERGGPGGFQGGGGPPGGGGRGGMMGGPGGQNQLTEMLKEIGVSDTVSAKVSAEMQTEMEAIRASMPQMQQGGSPLSGAAGGFGPPPGMMQQQQMNEMRQKFQTTQETVMRRNLTEDQYNQYTQKRVEMQSQKRAQMYVVNDKGALERKMVVIGLSDGNYAEIIRGAEEGDTFVRGATSTKAKK